MKELTIRRKLCERAEGTWVPNATGRGGTCNGGLCEQCGQPPDFRKLHPHEDPFKSHGGKLSMKSKMLCGKCHSAKHDIKEVESKITPSQPVDKPRTLAGYGVVLRPFSKAEQCGTVKRSTRSVKRAVEES